VAATAERVEPRGLIPAALVGVGLMAITLATASGRLIPVAAGVAAVGTLVALTRPGLLEWRRLVAALLLVILFVPIRRYTLPGNLPFQLEPYRVFVALLVVGWAASLLVDRRTNFRRTGFEGPLLLIVGSAVLSVVVNPDRVAQFSTEVNKSLMFLLSYVLVVYVIVSVIRRFSDIELLAKTLVVGGAIVATLSIVEARLGFNAFNHLATVAPFLQDQGDVGNYQRLGTAKLRVFGSAQHPIALSAALVMLLPLAMYLARRYSQRRWILCGIALGIAGSATISRTGILMFVVIVLVFLWLRPKEVRRLWPLLIPALIAIHFVLPGTLGAIKQSFMPAGGLLAEQRASADSSGSGRLADLGPALTLWEEQPLLGQGYGTQVVNLNAGGIEANIFDDQWLGTLLATGVIGFFGWLWFFVRAVRRFGREARRDDSERGWLLACFAAGIAAYAVGMLTFDAFAFIQVTFLMFIFVAIGSALLAERPTPHVVHAGPTIGRSRTSRT
jgi:O-antigen ligase